MLWSGQPAKQLCLCLVQCLEESQTSWPYWSMVRLLTLKMDLLLKISRERHGKILHKWALWLFQIPSTSLQRKIHHDWFVSMCIFFQKPILCNPTGCPTIKFNSDPIYLAAADAKLLQSCLTLCNPRDSSPPSSPVPGILQARTLEWVAISFSNAWKWKVKVKSLSHVWLFTTPWTAAHQAPPSIGFSRQEYWSGVPLPSPLLSLALSIF